MLFVIFCLTSLSMTIMDSSMLLQMALFHSFYGFLSNFKASRVLPRESTGHSKHPLPTTQDSTHGHHQMVNTKIRLIIFFAAKDGEAPNSHQKQDRKLTVAQIMNSLLPNSDLN